ncbi:MAG: TRAP transporter substrate-binding protein [Desulfobulbaceae bacterium]|nr:TRAP transporter substrate-binding protein [Desulfobulbaceae bacterium]
MKLVKLVIVAAIFACLNVSGVWAKPLTINVGYTGALGSPYDLLATKFAELANEYSNGEVNVKVRCCAQLATEDEAFKAMQLGTVDMYVITDVNVGPHFPLFDIMGLPYVFQSREHVKKVFDGPVGEKLAQDLYDATGVMLLTYGGVGYRDFYNTKRPINTMADLEGIKIRVPKNKAMIATWQAFGAAPIPLAWADTPPALQTGTVDGGDNGTSFIKAQKFYEIAPYLSILEHFAYITPLFASDRILSKMDDAQREAVMRAAKEAGEHHVKEMERELGELRSFLANEGGMEVTYPDKAEFIKVAQQVQDDFSADRSEEFKKLLQDIRDAAK